MIKKSPSDHRNYYPIELPNQLKVVLVESPESTKSAASMVINAGHFDDPDDCNGLAHFIEHMLFLGTDKYPEPEDYPKFVSHYGGHHNAWTSSEHTNFHFDIHHSAFEPALDRFSQFFIAPCFAQEYIDKERHAIESEFELKRKDDLRRLYQVHKETANPKHPFSRFSVGNLTTLIDKENLSLKQRLQHFFESHYHTQNMTLVLAGPQPKEMLAHYAEKYFGSIKHIQQTKPPLTQPIYLPEHQACKISMQTLRDANQLILSFCLDAVMNRYKDKSISYLSFMLGREDKGSLLHYLREKNWINSITAGGGVDASNFKDFNLSIQLTENGHYYAKEICHATFAYINFLQSQPIQEFVYEEKQQLSSLAFTYQENAKLVDWVSAIALKMHHYPIEDILIADYLMTGLDHKWVHDNLKRFTPKNMRMIELSTQEINNAQVCKWYDAPYSITPIEESTLRHWQQAKLGYSFSLPKPNPYIQKRHAQLDKEIGDEIPVKVINETGFVLWYMQDQRFQAPKSHIYLSLDLTQAQGSIERIASMQLFIEFFMDNIESDFYQAEAAGISYHVYPHQAGFTLHISGFSDKQKSLLTDILSSFKSYLTTTSQWELSRFNEVKLNMLHSLHNANKGKPISKLFNYLNTLLQTNQFTSEQLAHCIEDLSIDDLSAFSEALLNEVHIECLVYGDCNSETVKHIESRVRDLLLEKTQPCAEIPRAVFKLPEKQQSEISLATDHSDNCIIIYYQGADSSIKTSALFSLFNHIISPAFFNLLRTEKQLGYLLGTGYMPLNQQPGWIAYIQSNKASANELQIEIDDFLNDCPEQLAEIDEENWSMLKQGLIQQLMEKETGLRVAAQKYWLAIGLKDTQFNRRFIMADVINTLTLDDLIGFIQEHLVVTADTTRLVMKAHNENNASQVKTNINQFMASFQSAASQLNFNQ